jgi:[ribosomal protein S18]-alanine N-acetyltransferase
MPRRLRCRLHLGLGPHALVRAARTDRRVDGRLGRERRLGDFILRAARREDLATVLEIERRSFSHPWSLEAFLDEIRQAHSRLLLVWDESGERGKLVGYVCRWIVAAEVQILNIAIHPDWRRRGIGRGLVEAVLEEAREEGAARVTLEVRRYNNPAIGLYERLGFRRVGERRNYYGAGEDAVLMEKDVDGR